jgi:transcriptional regulator with XRE-family HTH domain
MTIQQEIGRLSREARDLSEFLERACKLRGVGVTRASVDAGLSTNAISSYILGRRRPSAESAYKLARYFGVTQGTILRLGGVKSAELEIEELKALGGEVHRVALALDSEELRQWIEYGEMLLLRRQRKIEEANRGKVEGERD